MRGGGLPPRLQPNGIRDCITLHDHLTRREDSPFRRHVRTMGAPELPHRKLEAFGRAGHLNPAHRDLFADPSWLQLRKLTRRPLASLPT